MYIFSWRASRMYESSESIPLLHFRPLFLLHTLIFSLLNQFAEPFFGSIPPSLPPSLPASLPQLKGRYTKGKTMAASGQEQKMGYYSILGLSNNASPCAIRNSYRKLAMKWHPDKCSNEDPTDAKLKFQEIQEAYTVLSDARKKVLYDNGLYDRNDDDEDIEGLSCFMNELSGLMAEVQATEKKDGKGNSFEELQQLFVDIFSTDNQMEAFTSPNSHPANTTRFNKKRSRQTEGSSPFFDDPGSCMRNAHIYFTDSFDNSNGNGNANAKATKKKKKSNTSQENSWGR